MTLGTSSFIKDTFCVGYTMKVSLHDQSDITTHTQELSQIVGNHIPDFKIIPSKTNKEISFSLRFQQQKNFPNMFAELEQLP